MKLLFKSIGIPHSKKKLARLTYSGIILVAILTTSTTIWIIQTKSALLETSLNPKSQHTPFPIGVNPLKKIITENDFVEIFFTEHVTIKKNYGQQLGLIRNITAKLATKNWFQNLASPTSRVLVIFSGERQEQVTNNFADILNWDREQKETFTDIITESIPKLPDGKFYPGHYIVSKYAKPEEVSELIIKEFQKEVLVRYSDEISNIVPIKDALNIASLLEREAYDFEDMRLISGVIWNRLFIDMNLQIDATLQYAKGSNPSQARWWPRVRPADKYINSPFNTYKNNGLPPAPISNPTSESILAALNPKKTDCIFYFHDKNSKFHCSPTYEGHVVLLKKYYGQGR